MKTYAEALEALCRMARDGRWREGTRLPPERELSERLGTSRPTLRKILGRFELRGALSRRRRGGTVLLEELDPALLGEGAPAQVVSFVAPFGDDKSDGGRQRFLQDELLKCGFILNAYLASRDKQDPEMERKYLKSLFKIRPAGLIIIATPLGATNAPILAELAGTGVRIVHLELYRDELPAEPFVIPDWRLAGTRAAAMLRMHGARQVAVANPRGRSPAALKIIEGVNSTARALGMEIVELGVECASGDRRSGRLRNAVKTIGAGTGVVATHSEAASMIAAEHARLYGAGAAARRVVAVHEDDEGAGTAKGVATFAFSWKERAAEAMRYIVGRDRREGPRLLVESKLLRQQHLHC